MKDVKKAADTSKKLAETRQKEARAMRELKTKTDILRKNPDSGTCAIDVKYAAEKVKKLNNEVNRLQSDFKRYS